ncbi:MAG: hypothetical protein D6788_12145 [Planctomycetota bacterium]|nr:MAG: hypothetical protein D6788_12145 [Planctomycetota bacterium]
MRSLASVLPATPVRRLVYTSSTRVYGRDDGSWVEEDTPPEPRDEKGRILLQSERIALAAFTPSFPRRDPDVARVSSRADRSVTVLRLGGIHGPGREAEPRIVAQAGTTRDDGNVYVNLIHRDDIVETVRRLLRMPYHGVLNLTDGHPVLRRVWYDRMLAMRNLPAIDWTDRDAPVRGKRVSNMRARKLLGLDFRTPVP